MRSLLCLLIFLLCGCVSYQYGDMRVVSVLHTATVVDAKTVPCGEKQCIEFHEQNADGSVSGTLNAVKGLIPGGK